MTTSPPAKHLRTLQATRVPGRHGPERRRGRRLARQLVEPDIVILDVLVSDGRRFADELRRSRPRAVPVILTGRVDLSARWPGVVDFLYKPIDEGELVETIGQALKRIVG